MLQLQLLHQPARCPTSGLDGERHGVAQIRAGRPDVQLDAVLKLPAVQVDGEVSACEAHGHRLRRAGLQNRCLLESSQNQLGLVRLWRKPRLIPVRISRASLKTRLMTQMH